jgi:thioredoxin-like negative regulator of GroEL
MIKEMKYLLAQNSEEIKKNINENAAVMLLFTDGSCNVGDALSPKLQQLVADEFSELTLIEINVRLLPEVKGEFNVFVIPTVLVFFDGKETIRHARFINVEQLKKEIKRLYTLLFE